MFKQGDQERLHWEDDIFAKVRAEEVFGKEHSRQRKQQVQRP